MAKTGNSNTPRNIILLLYSFIALNIAFNASYLVKSDQGQFSMISGFVVLVMVLVFRIIKKW